MRFWYPGLKHLVNVLLCTSLLLLSNIGVAEEVTEAVNQAATRDNNTEDNNTEDNTEDNTQKVTEKNPDPWRKVNEKSHAFNEFFDRNLLKPVAKGYNYITPEPLNKGITNFFNNLGEPVVMVNDLLQAKGKEAAVDLGRFGINTTLGLLGFFDVATRMSLHKNNEDFGQTLGKWGVPSGPYVVIPFLGPSTVRDGLAKIPASFTNLNPAVAATDDPNVVIAATVIDLIDTRADLLKVEKMIIGDRYTGMRDIFLQLREFDVKDGQVEDDFMSEDW